MPKPLPQITRREDSEAKDRIISSGDLSRKGLMIYLFGDFLLGLYGVGCIFLDLLIVEPLYTYIPNYQETLSITSHVFLLPIVSVYFIILIVFLELTLIYFQIKGFVRLRKRLNYKDHELPPADETAEH